MGYSYLLPLKKESKGKTIELTTLIDSMKILVATEKPFAKVAVDGIRAEIEKKWTQRCWTQPKS